MSLQEIFLIIIIIAGASFSYKIYLHSKLKVRKETKPSFLFPKPANIFYFLPISKKGKPQDQHAIINKANWALFIFYASFIVVAIIILVYDYFLNRR